MKCVQIRRKLRIWTLFTQWQLFNQTKILVLLLMCKHKVLKLFCFFLRKRSTQTHKENYTIKILEKNFSHQILDFKVNLVSLIDMIIWVITFRDRNLCLWSRHPLRAPSAPTCYSNNMLLYSLKFTEHNYLHSGTLSREFWVWSFTSQELNSMCSPLTLPSFFFPLPVNFDKI